MVNPKVLIEMDWQDEQSGKMEETHQKLQSAYCQLTLTTLHQDATLHEHPGETVASGLQDLENLDSGLVSLISTIPQSSHLSGSGKVFIVVLFVLQERLRHLDYGLGIPHQKSKSFMRCR
mgnify:CR=1 FL=1